MIFGLSESDFLWIAGRWLAAYAIGFGLGWLLLQFKRLGSSATKTFG
jgi:hypothetical protein